MKDKKQVPWEILRLVVPDSVSSLTFFHPLPSLTSLMLCHKILAFLTHFCIPLPISLNNLRKQIKNHYTGQVWFLSFSFSGSNFSVCSLFEYFGFLATDIKRIWCVGCLLVINTCKRKGAKKNWADEEYNAHLTKNLTKASRENLCMGIFHRPWCG